MANLPAPSQNRGALTAVGQQTVKVVVVPQKLREQISKKIPSTKSKYPPTTQSPDWAEQHYMHELAFTRASMRYIHSREGFSVAVSTLNELNADERDDPVLPLGVTVAGHDANSMKRGSSTGEVFGVIMGSGTVTSVAGTVKNDLQAFDLVKLDMPEQNVSRGRVPGPHEKYQRKVPIISEYTINDRARDTFFDLFQAVYETLASSTPMILDTNDAMDKMKDDVEVHEVADAIEALDRDTIRPNVQPYINLALSLIEMRQNIAMVPEYQVFGRKFALRLDRKPRRVFARTTRAYRMGQDYVDLQLLQ